MTLKVYLAHTWDCKETGEIIGNIYLQNLDLQIINPFDHDPDEIKTYSKEDAEKYLEENNVDILTEDLELIKESDVLLAYYMTETTGTAIEIFYNSHVLGRGKEKTLVYTSRKIGRHPFIKELATTLHTIKGVESHLERIITGEEER